MKGVSASSTNTFFVEPLKKKSKKNNHSGTFWKCIVYVLLIINFNQVNACLSLPSKSINLTTKDKFLTLCY